METKDILNHVHENGGITLTVNLYGPKEMVTKASGFMVSVSDNERSIKGAGRYVDVDAFGQYVLDTTLEALKTNRNDVYVGIWDDSTDTRERFVFDVSVHVEDYEKAIALGKEHNQNAIYDCANDSDIYL